jgi:Fis family transcriptional regulator
MEELGTQVESFVRDARASNLNLKEVVRQVRRCFIVAALVDNNFNQCRAARDLGMHRNTVTRTLVALDVDIAVLRGDTRKEVGRVAPHRAQQRRA